MALPAYLRRSKICVILGFLAAATLGLSHAQDLATLSLTPKDIRYVQIQLNPGDHPKVDIYFTKKKLAEAHELITANLDKPFNIVMDGKLVATPRIKHPLYYKKQFVTLGFPDLDAAVAAARTLVPMP
jgi:preprotein translocase subunit SecD